MAYGPYDFPCVSSLYKNDQHQQNSNSRNCFGGLIKKHLFPSHLYDFVCVCVCFTFHPYDCVCVCVCACFTSHPYDFLCVCVCVCVHVSHLTLMTFFVFQCIRTWFRQQTTCPECRTYTPLLDDFPKLK